MPRKNINARRRYVYRRLRELPAEAEPAYIDQATTLHPVPIAWVTAALAALEDGNTRAAELRLRAALHLLRPTGAAA